MRAAILCITLVWGATALAGPASDMIDSLSEAQRKSAFRAAVTSANYDCPSVERTFYKGDSSQDNSAYYAVRCAGADCIVRISNDGDMASSTTPCEIMAALNISCWEPF